jgi:hypothetical protein
MRHLRIYRSVLATLFFAPTAFAQTGNWQAVKQLEPGMKISVQVDHHSLHSTCYFQRATDDQLFCERVLHGVSRVLIPPDAAYDRKEIREVRIEHSDRSNTAAGAAIGGGVGATLGAANGNGTLTREGGALLLGTVGALIGGSFGRDFPIFHGKVIYRR